MHIWRVGARRGGPLLAALVGELSVRSQEFRVQWAAHHVRDKTHGSYRFRHPLVGELELSYETLRLPDDPDQALITYTVTAGSPSQDVLRLLAGLTANAPARRL